MLGASPSRRSTSVGDLIGRHRQKQAIGEAMRAVAEVNKYVSDTEPWKLKGEDAARAARHRAARRRPSASPTSTWCWRRSCRSRPTQVDAALGGTGDVRADAADRARSRTSTDGAPVPGHHRRLHRRPGLASGGPSWSGTPVAKPTPVFTKLDPSVVEEELARLAASEAEPARAGASGGRSPGCLHLHPEWPFGDGTVIEAMAARRDLPVAVRDRHVQRRAHRVPRRRPVAVGEPAVRGRYDAGPAAERPVYGALDTAARARRRGPVRLGVPAAAAARCSRASTFCFPDSVFEPEHVGGRRAGPLLDARGATAPRRRPRPAGRLRRGARARRGPAGPRRRGRRAGPLLPRRPRRGRAAGSPGLCRSSGTPGFRVATAGLDPAYRGPERVGAGPAARRRC